MATKYTKEQLQQMLADMENETDDDEEIIIEDKGRKFHMRGKRATSVLDKLFADYGIGPDDGSADDDQSTDDGADEGKQDESGTEDDPAPKETIWGRKK